MKKNVQKTIGAVSKLLAATVLALLFSGGQSWGVLSDYGWRGGSSESILAEDIAFYNARGNPLFLGDDDRVIGLAELSGGFHSETDSSITFTDVSFPVSSDVYLHSGTRFYIEGDLTLSTTKIDANGSFMVDANGNTLFLEKDTTLPGQTIQLRSDLVIDGQGNTVTFNGSTIIDLGAHVLTLKNMSIKGLTGSSQFAGTGTLYLQNCVVNLPSTATWTYGNANLTITDDVVVQGGGTFQFGSAVAMAIGALSTLYIDYDTTFDYNCATLDKLAMSDATSTLYINGGTLKAQGAQGLQLTTGRLILEDKCTLDNGTNTDMNKGIQLGNGTTDVTVKVLAGARVQVNGSVWHNPG
jgi:hypothetical protein